MVARTGEVTGLTGQISLPSSPLLSSAIIRPRTRLRRRSTSSSPRPRRDASRPRRSCRAEPLRPDAARIVAERDERVGNRFNESGWPADVDERALGRRPTHIREERGVDAARATAPLLRLFVCQRDDRVVIRELVAKDQVATCTRGVEEPRGDLTRSCPVVSQDCPQRHYARPARNQQHGTANASWQTK